MGEKPFLCSICFKPINLADCKTDEGGRFVHRECHAQLLLHKPLTREPLEPGKLPRIIRLMAVLRHFHQLLKYRDYAH